MAEFPRTLSAIARAGWTHLSAHPHGERPGPTGSSLCLSSSRPVGRGNDAPGRVPKVQQTSMEPFIDRRPLLQRPVALGAPGAGCAAHGDDRRVLPQESACGQPSAKCGARPPYDRRRASPVGASTVSGVVAVAAPAVGRDHRARHGGGGRHALDPPPASRTRLSLMSRGVAARTPLRPGAGGGGVSPGPGDRRCRLPECPVDPQDRARPAAACGARPERPTPASTNISAAPPITNTKEVSDVTPGDA